mgnify:CR=1 FL=1
MLFIGPLLVTRFSGYFTRHTKNSLTERQQELGFLIRFEMVLATILPLILNVVWTPVIDALTQNKYGAVNKTTFLLLSLCIPFQYMINLFWTIHFSLNHLALIFRITAVTCIVIVAGDLFMISLMNARGAALVYLAAMLAEYLLYLKHSFFAGARNSLLPLAICTGIAFFSGWIVYYLDMPVFAALVLSVTIYCILLIVTGQVRKNDLGLLKQWISNRDNDIKFAKK